MRSTACRGRGQTRWWAEWGEPAGRPCPCSTQTLHPRQWTQAHWGCCQKERAKTHQARSQADTRSSLHQLVNRVPQPARDTVKQQGGRSRWGDQHTQHTTYIHRYTHRHTPHTQTRTHTDTDTNTYTCGHTLGDTADCARPWCALAAGAQWTGAAARSRSATAATKEC